jgi:hypothetical protein
MISQWINSTPRWFTSAGEDALIFYFIFWQKEKEKRSPFVASQSVFIITEINI